ncbi:hypothetical protein BZA77DRAFT_293493 [Pyronema omphalodes]|nr:hypothetical protein BZA77DRAFT_293493 [Pyronema omphalodes]
MPASDSLDKDEIARIIQNLDHFLQPPNERPATPVSDESTDAAKTPSTEVSSCKRFKASDSDNDYNAAREMILATTITAVKKTPPLFNQTIQGLVKQSPPYGIIHLPTEMIFMILECCSDDTLLKFARTSKAYNDVIQPMMIYRALEIPYDENFTLEYPMLEHHDRRCPLTCAIVNSNDVLLNNLIKREYFPMDGLFHSGMGLAMMPLHWVIQCSKYRRKNYIGAIKTLLEIGGFPNTYNHKHIDILWHPSS